MICGGQVMPLPGSKEEKRFFLIDVAITAVFTVELLINIFAHRCVCLCVSSYVCVSLCVSVSA
jgi:hypothetical protein